MSEVLKSNTTLTELNLSCRYKINNAQMAPINDPLPYIKTTANGVGKRGTTSLSEALKSNKALTKLDLSSEDRRDNTQMTSINNLFFI